MAILNRDIFLEIQEELGGKKYELVEVLPGFEARIVQLTAEAGFAMLSGHEDEKVSVQEGTLRWIAACCRDENNEQVFTVDELKKLPFDLVQKMARAVNTINGIATSAGAEEAEKNSAAAG